MNPHIFYRKTLRQSRRSDGFSTVAGIKGAKGLHRFVSLPQIAAQASSFLYFLILAKAWVLFVNILVTEFEKGNDMLRGISKIIGIHKFERFFRLIPDG